MLYNLEWLTPGLVFPPSSEIERVKTYYYNEKYFASEHASANFGAPYYQYVQRITRVIGNAADFISFPVLFNYQRLMALKTADLVCGEYPIIASKDESSNEAIDDTRENIDFDTKAYATALDLCRYGDCIWRMYKKEDGTYTFTVWDIKDWYPIVSQDGTLTIVKHVLAWIETLGPIGNEYFRLHVQIHSAGSYETRVYEVSSVAATGSNFSRTIGKQIGKSDTVQTGLKENAVIHIRNMSVSNTIYGYDDFTPIDSMIAELMTRVAQISKILDKHADPSMTGPASMLKRDSDGLLYFQSGDFYGVNPGEDQPKFLTWEGELASSFKQMEMLFNQLYIVSEMGSALLGAGGAESGQAISGTAMRFKMTNPLAKARRMSNLLTLPVKQLFEVCGKIPKKNISIVWQDGLPDDPREVMELVKLATGETRIMPLKTAIEEILKRNPDEAAKWIAAIELVKKEEADAALKVSEAKSVMPGGEQPNKKGSDKSLDNFSRKSANSDDKNKN